MLVRFIFVCSLLAFTFATEATQGDNSYKEIYTRMHLNICVYASIILQKNYARGCIKLHVNHHLIFASFFPDADQPDLLANYYEGDQGRIQ